MTSDDQVRPYHAKDEGQGQEAANAVAAVLKHAAEREKAAKEKPRPKRQPKWMLPLGINLAVLAVYLLIAPPAWVTVNPIEGPDLATQVSDLRRAMYLQAQRVIAYQVRYGSLPERLEETGSTVPGVEYHRQGVNAFQLIGLAGDETVVYDSTQSTEEFEQAVASKMAGG